MEELYELQTIIQEQSLQMFQMANKIKTLENENKQLKQNIELLALEQSTQMQQKPKRKICQEVTDRWKYYHNNKTEIATTYDLQNWRTVKAKCDELFASNR